MEVLRAVLLVALPILFAGFLIAMSLVLIMDGPEEDSDQKMRASMYTIFAVAATVWPMVWYFTIGNQLMLVGNSPLIIFGGIWPQMLLLIDMVSSSNKELRAEQNNLVNTLQADANSLILIAFSMGTLVLSNWLGAQTQMASVIVIVLFALLLCIAFVVPQPITQEKSRNALVAASVQRALFVYAMGFVVTALAVTIQMYVRKKSQ